MPFQFKSKNVFLTYAQCPIQKEEALRRILLLCPGTAILVGHETHEDGGHHLHVFIQSTEPIRTRNERFFDLDNYHPNIQSARQPKSTYAYCKKEGDYVEHGTFSLGTRTSPYELALTQTTASAFKQSIRESNPRDYVLQYDRIEAFARLHYGPQKIPYESRYDPLDFSATEEMTSFWNQLQSDIPVS